MKRIKNISLLLVLIMILSNAVSFANGLNDTEEIRVEKEEKWRKGPVKSGEIIEISFEYEVLEADMTIPEGIKFLSYEDGIYKFEVTKDMDRVEGSFKYGEKHGSNQTEKENGEGNNHGVPGTGTPTEDLDWNGFALGKHSWNVLKDPNDQNSVIPNLKQYAIRIDLKQYYDYSHIILRDIGRSDLKLEDFTDNKIEVRKLKNNNNKVETSGNIDYKVIYDKGNEFAIEIPVDKETLVYDVVYYMSYENPEPTNEYKVYTEESWKEVISSGEISGESSDDSDNLEDSNKGQSIYVEKKWMDKDKNIIKPNEEEITIVLYDEKNKDDKHTIILSEKNGWKYIFNDLKENVEYKLIETSANKDKYEVTIEKIDNNNTDEKFDTGYTIINRLIEERPESDNETPDPTEPTEPEDSPYEKPGYPINPKEESKPTKPNKNEPTEVEKEIEREDEKVKEPEQPGEPVETNIDSSEVNNNKKNEEKIEEVKTSKEEPKKVITNILDKNKAPQTGDEFSLALNLLVLIVSIIGFYFLIKKENNK